jgi:hypothetical protein
MENAFAAMMLEKFPIFRGISNIIKKQIFEIKHFKLDTIAQ